MQTSSFSRQLPKLIALVMLITAIGLHVVLRAAEIPKHQPLIRGPLFISVVFPVLDLERDRMEFVEPILDAYSFWGKMIVSTTDQKTYSPGPFSYPYHYTQQGLIKLERQLKRSSDIIPGSTQVKTFPNIPKEQQGVFGPQELSQILTKEPYLSFRLKRWDDVELMAFPSFVVLTFDYTRRPITAERDYEAVKTRFSQVINDFLKWTSYLALSAFLERSNPGLMFRCLHLRRSILTEKTSWIRFT
jgi:hypothetical protein